MWVKGIYAKNGTIDLHGFEYKRTWSRLAEAVAAGDEELYLQHSVNWEAGQTIMLATSYLKDSRDFNRNEVRTIASVAASSTGGSLITLESAVAYRHEASEAYQVEVALLSRRIKIMGSADDSTPTDAVTTACAEAGTNLAGDTSSPCSDSYLTGYGGHVLAHGTEATLRTAGIELVRMGQTNVMGRYPLHMHMMKDEGGARSYVHDCSVHESYYRGITIHGTHNATVAHNTAYDIIGHCYYFEDGVEENNTVAYNFAGHVHFLGDHSYSNSFTGQWADDVPATTSLTLPADISAAGFYFPNR
eukprot:5417120-Prymnesium_polylepis.1